MAKRGRPKKNKENQATPIPNAKELNSNKTQNDEETQPPERPVIKRCLDSESEFFGLIDNFDYKYDDYGFIDWKSMIPDIFIFPNKDKLNKLGKDTPKSIHDLEDEFRLVKLAGFKWLARVRGFESVSFDKIDRDNRDGFTIKCTIIWTPNSENPTGVSYEGIASCNSDNANGIGLKFKESIAANRAFVRCVRNFLNIDILGEEEIFDESGLDKPLNEDNTPVAITPQTILLKLMRESGLSDEQILIKCGEKNESLKGCASIDKLVAGMTPQIAKEMLKDIKSVT